MITRRAFLWATATAGGGLLVGVDLVGCESRDHRLLESARAPSPPTQLDAWIRIDPDNQILVSVPESEMGQGVLTSIPMIIADELGARWQDVRSAHAPLDREAFGRQSTGGSTSIREGYEPIRTVAAAAREMLAAAAATRWGVSIDALVVRDGKVAERDGARTLPFGQLVAEAALLPPPERPALKPASELRLIGKPLRRLDSPAKVDGSARFGIDVRLPGMLTAQIARCPIFGGTVASFDRRRAEAVPGVRRVLEIRGGLAVVADHFWAASEGRRALDVKWSGGETDLDDKAIADRCREWLATARTARRVGAPASALGRAARRIEAVYQVPYLAHAPMEPLNCTADVQTDRCRLWVPTQNVSGSAALASELTRLPPEAIEVNTTFLGGGFGRRSQTDFVQEAVLLSMAVGRPVKVVWTREDGIRAGYYRPVSYNRMRGGLDARGTPVAWLHDIASPSILESLTTLPDGIDPTSTSGAADLPYAIPNIAVSYANPRFPIPVWFWRSVGNSQNAYVTECFIDELARAGHRDPLELRRELLSGAPRHSRVLEKAAEAAGWNAPLPKGRARGLAVHQSFGSFVAQVATVSIERGEVRVHSVVCAVDCGGVINPDTVRAQMESGIAWGLSAALYGRVSIADGRAVQSNFDDYRVVRLRDMPPVETHIIAEGDPLGGIGEVAVPPIAPAVCNAVFALTGKPVRSLPIALT